MLFRSGLLDLLSYLRPCTPYGQIVTKVKARGGGVVHMSVGMGACQNMAVYLIICKPLYSVHGSLFPFYSIHQLCIRRQSFAKTIFLPLVKRQNNIPLKIILEHYLFYFSNRAHKCIFSQNFVHGHKMFGCTHDLFFVTFQNIFRICFL